MVPPLTRLSVGSPSAFALDNHNAAVEIPAGVPQEASELNYFKIYFKWDSWIYTQAGDNSPAIFFNE